jgi:hypothetical protein
VDFIDVRHGLLRHARAQPPGVDVAALLAAYFRAVGDGSRSKRRGADTGARESLAARSKATPEPRGIAGANARS